MFRNSGRKLTVFVKILFWLNLLLVLGVVGVAVYALVESRVPVYACLLVIAGALFYLLMIYVSLLMLNAFAELSQSNVDLRRMLAEEIRRSRETPAYVPPVEAKPLVTPAAPEKPREEPAQDWMSPEFQAPAYPVPAPEEAKPAPAGAVFCRRCGAKHERGTASCRYCGTPLA